MATTRKTDEEISEPEPLGKEGDICAQCGTKLAVDQRYCLNCGTARAEPRLDYERHLPASSSAADPNAAGSSMQWSPLLAIVAIAILGVMLLLGVLIGQDDTKVTVTAVPATTTTPASTGTATETFPTTTTPTDTTPADSAGGSTAPDTGTTTNPKGDAAAGGIAPND